MFRRTPIALAILACISPSYAQATDYDLTTSTSTSSPTALTANDTATIADGQKFGGTSTNSDDDIVTLSGAGITVTVNGQFMAGEDLIKAVADTSNLTITIGSNGSLIATENSSGNAYDAIDLNGDGSGVDYSGTDGLVATNASITVNGSIWVADKGAIDASDSTGTSITNSGTLSARDDTIKAKDVNNLTITNTGTISADGNAKTYNGQTEQKNSTSSYDAAISFFGDDSSRTLSNSSNYSTGLTLTNQTSGQITADYETIKLYDGAGNLAKTVSITNHGTISATKAARTSGGDEFKDGAIYAQFVDGFTLTNTGTVTAKDDTINLDDFTGTATITNSGTINSDRRYAISAAQNASNTATLKIVNTGTISATGSYAIYANDTENITVTNSGTITSTDNALDVSDSATATITNNGTIKATTGNLAIDGEGVGTLTVVNNGTLSAVNRAIYLDAGATFTNTGTITTTLGSGNEAIFVNGNNNTIKLSEGSKLIGDIEFAASTTGNTLEMDIGSGRSYVLSVTDNNTTWTLTDKDGRTAIKGSAKSAATGNLETADEILGYRSQAINSSLYRFQRNATKNSNFDFYAGNNKRTKAGTDTATYSQTLTGFTYVNPSETSNLGLVIGCQNSDLSIQSGAQNLDSNTLIAGIQNTTDNGHVKALVTYTKNKASQEVLDNTSSTGYTTYKGDYSSYGAIVGLGTTVKKDFGANQNISLMFDVDIAHERISAWNETATFKWKARSLTQATANLKTEWRLEDEDSLTYINAGISARSLMSGKQADYSIDTTNTSFSGGDTSSTAFTVGLGHESKLSENSSAKFGVDANFASGERSVTGWMSIESKF